MTDIFVILFLLLGLIGISVRKKEEYSDYISKEQSGSIEALLIYGVFLIHLSSYVSSGILLRWFFLLDKSIVGLFFFYSGYGLLTGYMKNGDKYAFSLLKRKIPTLGIPWLICALIYGVGYLLGMESTAAPIQGALIHNIIENIGEWVANGWFVFVLILFYVFFVISVRLAKNSVLRLIIIDTAMITAYVIIMLRLHMGFWWYFRSCCFTIGLIWCAYREKIEGFFRKYTILHLSAASLAVLSLLILLNFGYRKTEYLLTPLLTVWVQLLCMKFRIGNPILSWLSKYQFSFYLIHGLMLGVLRGKMIYTANDFIFALSALALTLAGAMALNFVSHKLTGAPALSAK